ncbi:GNAT family N-acetyltransferase [Paraburkholderia susongensis]|uniref:Protein N-acetyltransferase, RimJ/RimL family n=1 Tax=Paraburkholderia susongensis TaxID=1515439 RepID=A0A1X7M1A0_9BURK|nr:GNAT family N-acetyltransferase [Paraburkholderia susongensis]SMG59956.1 Protein N-acetyltransferase, RimJ/RimL family [Paraburkholderia susongensis]
MRTDIAADEIALRHAAAPLPAARYAMAPEAVIGRHAKHTASVDGFEIRAIDIAHDAPTLHRWFVEERAAFWNMRDKSVEDVAVFYQAIQNSGHAQAWIGSQHGASAFLFESYHPAHDEVGEHYDVQPGDLGMHLFVGPAAQPVPGYTHRVFRSLMTFLFEHLSAARVVVEPDARNARIHALNRAMGFVYAKNVAFREKTASLAFCTRADFYAALQATTQATTQATLQATTEKDQQR